LPLSFAQQRLWFLDQFQPGNPFYNMPVAVRLAGDLNLSALTQTLTEIVRRHEVLRTRYVTVGRRPAQVIDGAFELGLAVEDRRGRTPAERAAIARGEASSEAERPFELREGPVIRARLLAFADDDHLLLLSLHHIVSDAWSQGVLQRELRALYGAFSTGEPSPLPELPVQYADYAAWQRRWFSGEVEASQLAYWRGQLDGAAPVLDLPTDRPRPAEQSHRGASRAFTVPAALAGALRELSRREGATLFMTLLAAFDTSATEWQSEMNA
jgi:hypothetical protein